MEIEPNCTVYINNLNDKLSKKKLVEYLYILCIRYGRIVNICATKSMTMRGQAFVTFETIPEAISAIKSLQGLIFFGKCIRIQFAKSKEPKYTNQLEFNKLEPR